MQSKTGIRPSTNGKVNLTLMWETEQKRFGLRDYDMC